MKRILMIAYHFPPTQGSSGVHRTVQFARHLKRFGWEPLIVTVHPRAYPKTGKDFFGGLPRGTTIKRAFALDTAKHLSFKKRYLGLTAIPDRWVSWWPFGVLTCLKLIKKYKPTVIWSTFPIASAHLIGLTVQRLTGLPWVADFRDPMIQGQHPESGIERRTFQWIEKKTIQHSSVGVFVTRSALKKYTHLYPDKPSNYWRLIENGYDESLFSGVTTSRREGRHPIKMVHSGILYSKGRNPLYFLQALKSYLEKGGEPVEVILRGAGEEIDIANWISSLGLDDIVKVKPSISYGKAIEEMMQSDVLILFQGAEYNNQIPAKIYEYIRAGHPILALTDSLGETARFLKNWDGIYMGNMKDPEEIELALNQIVNSIQKDKKPVRDPKIISALSRKARTLNFSEILNELD